MSKYRIGRISAMLKKITYTSEIITKTLQKGLIDCRIGIFHSFPLHRKLQFEHYQRFLAIRDPVSEVI